MTILEEYFRKNYDVYLRLKNKLEIQEIEQEIELEKEFDEFKNLEKEGVGYEK